METKLTIDEQTILAMFRSLDEFGKRELLRHASERHKDDAASAYTTNLSGQCKLERGEERPEIAAEPIFTE